MTAAHFRPVTVLRFTDDGSHVVSGGEDSIVRVWALHTVLAQDEPEPVHSWAEHSLPVSDIAVGCGGLWARVATASRDRTVKLWELASGTLLCSLTFPAEITALALDLAESFVFAGCTDACIYKVPLQPEPPASLPSALDIQQSADRVFTAHEQEITALALTLDSTQLVSTAKDSTLKIWDTASCQCLKSLETKGDISALVTVPAAFLAINDVGSFD